MADADVKTPVAEDGEAVDEAPKKPVDPNFEPEESMWRITVSGTVPSAMAALNREVSWVESHILNATRLPFAMHRDMRPPGMDPQ